MKKILFIAFIFCSGLISQAQPAGGYYNNTEGLDGEALKSALNDIIQGHTELSYYSSKYVLAVSDQDPDNAENVILVYTGRSQDAGDYGSGGNDLNREHVWAKSHGDFGTEPPAGSDVHNLKPADASVNSDRSNLDFDNGGATHPEATGCKYDSDSWEPRDEVKGDIARIIFYMATRYEGEDGEPDLSMADEVNTYPLPQHGKLSTLLLWNEQDPPDEFEMNRNNVIESYQHNRNPFVDFPDFARLIWGDEAASEILIANISITPEVPAASDIVSVSADISFEGMPVALAQLEWGTEWNDMPNVTTMDANGTAYTADIPAQAEGTHIYYRVKATADGEETMTPVYHYYLPAAFNGQLVSIYDVQGQTDVSPYADQIIDASGTQNLNFGEISVSGVVTANFGDKYFIQDGSGAWNGLMAYDPGRNPAIGDSVILTGIIAEYFGGTEMKNVSAFYTINSNKPLPQPAIISTGEADEDWEGVLVRVENAICTDANYQANYYMWTVDDGSGPLLIHNTSVYEYDPTEDVAYNITGPMNFDFDEWKIELRSALDVEEGSDVTPPEVESLDVVSGIILKLIFNEAVDVESAENLANYSISSGIVVEDAMRHQFQATDVYLTVSELNTGDYTLTVSNVEDLFGNVMIEENIDFEFEGSGIFHQERTHELFVFPNPAHDIVRIEGMKEMNNATLNLKNVLGQQIFERQINTTTSGSYVLKLPDGLYGLYLLQINADDGKYYQKIFVY